MAGTICHHVYEYFSKRAKEIFVALDFNGDGAVTEDEFVRS